MHAVKKVFDTLKGSHVLNSTKSLALSIAPCVFQLVFEGLV